MEGVSVHNLHMSKKSSINATRTLRREMTVRIIVFLLSLVLAVLIAEILLRFFYPQNLNITKLDQELSFVHKKSITSILQRQEFSTQVRISSQGLRDREFERVKPSNVTRIAIVGDSFVFGFGVEEKDTFSKILERKLNLGGAASYEVMNFGISGYGTEQELLLIKNEVLAYDPDIVVLSFYPNDVDDNMRRNLFSFSNGTLSKNPPSSIHIFSKFRNFISWHSHLYSLTYFSVIDNQQLKITLRKWHILHSSEPDLNKNHTLMRYLNDRNEDYQEAFDKTLALIQTAAYTVENHNSTFILLLIPEKEQLDESFMQELANKNKINMGDINRTKIQQDIKTNFRASSLIILDLHKDFSKEMENGSSIQELYFSIDGHWRKKGHEVAASSLYAAIGPQNKSFNEKSTQFLP